MEFVPFIGVFLAVAAIPILVVELVLTGLRGVCGPTLYAGIAGVVRGLTYAPCLLGGGCGAAMVPLFVGLIVGALQKDYVVEAWRGAPFLLVVAVSFLCSTLLQERQRTKNGAEPNRAEGTPPKCPPADPSQPAAARPPQRLDEE